MRRLRLLPIVLVAAASLLVLKTTGLLTSGGYTLKGLGAQAGEPAPEITGTISAAGPPRSDGRVVPIQDGPQVPPGERAVLERLQERRQELERRSRELDIREGLLKAAEQRLEARLDELKALEARLAAAARQNEEAEAARLKGVVAMYEAMKPKDAARIFDRLDLKVLVEVALKISPRRMSDILAQMSPEAAQRLTVELAARAGGKPAPVQASADHLPKIEGRPRR